MTNNKTNTTLTKKGKNTMTTAYLEDKFTDKTFNETIFIMCDCNCPQCNDEVEVEVEFEATAHQYEYQGEIFFDVDVRQIISAIAFDSNCQSIVDKNGVRDECQSIAEDFAQIE